MAKQNIIHENVLEPACRLKYDTGKPAEQMVHTSGLEMLFNAKRC